MLYIVTIIFLYRKKVLRDCIQNNTLMIMTDPFIVDWCEMIFYLSTKKNHIKFFITGCRDTFTSSVGRFAFGGSEVTASSVQDCGNKCLSSAQTCYGYDWDGKCFLHLNRDNLNNLQTGTGVTNYRRQFTCNPTNQPPGGVTQPAPGKTTYNLKCYYINTYPGRKII